MWRPIAALFLFRIFHKVNRVTDQRDVTERLFKGVGKKRRVTASLCRWRQSAAGKKNLDRRGRGRGGRDAGVKLYLWNVRIEVFAADLS